MFEQACMAITKDEYYTKILQTLFSYNDCKNSPFSNKNIVQAVSRVMAETEEEERDARYNAKILTMGKFFRRSPVTNNTQGDIVNETSERWISSDILAETINGFNEFTI